MSIPITKDIAQVNKLSKSIIEYTQSEWTKYDGITIEDLAILLLNLDITLVAAGIDDPTLPEGEEVLIEAIKYLKLQLDRTEKYIIDKEITYQQLLGN